METPQEQAPPSPKAPDIWQKLWERLVLTEADSKLLKEKRGFSEHTISTLGFRSSQASNHNIISDLKNEFPINALVHAGILQRAADGEFWPNPQFCGFGMTNEKDEKGKRIWKNNVNPILIPYRDKQGKVTSIRPHKGNIKRPDHIDDLDDTYIGIQSYCPYLLRTVAATPSFKDANPVTPAPESDIKPEDAPAFLPFCVITEGEFKAAALWQCGIPAMAFPGIQSLRNSIFRKNFVDMLKEFQITEVIVIFDNEEKGDPNLPSYKPDPDDRYDSLVYSRYSAYVLYRDGIQRSRVGWLPDDWRIDGKADWDGALSTFVKSADDVAAGTLKARKEFLRVIRSASHDKGFLDLFPSEAQRVVEAKLSRLHHQPLCLAGGDDLRATAQKIKPLNPSLSRSMMNCVGKYYTRSPITKSESLTELIQEVTKYREAKDFTKAREVQERIDGYPAPISTFTLTCDYKLVTADHKTKYLVRLRNVHNEKTDQHVILGPGEMSSLKQFREWCNNYYCTWMGGEKDLQNLTGDIQAHCAHRVIYEVDHYGWSDDIKLWKFADRAFTSEGKLILPDKNKVFWHGGIGYQTDFDQKRVGEGFAMGAPTLGEYNLDHASESFLLLSNHLKDALGDYDGWLFLGLAVSYAAHPEILAAYMGAPGIWLTGRRGGGKSTLCEWIIHIWGLPGNKISLTGATTDNFVSRELAKYGCLPSWFDEFDASNTRPEVQDQFKNAFNRSVSGKATFDGSKRTRGVKPLSSPLVSGETGVRDSATRSRYLQLTILDERSKGNPTDRLKEMNKNLFKFPSLGQFIMLHRQEYVQLVMSKLTSWVDDPKTSEFITKPRDRFVSGTPFAAWSAAAELLFKHGSDTHKADIYELLQHLENFRIFALEHGGETQKETSETTHINNFWHHILTMLQVRENFEPNQFFRLRWAEVDQDRRVVKEWENKVEGTCPVLYMAYESAYFRYEQEIRKAGHNSKMSMGDLLRELKREKYFLKPKQGQTSHRQTLSTGRPTCWALNLNEHPLGEELQNFFEDLLKSSDRRELGV